MPPPPPPRGASGQNISLGYGQQGMPGCLDTWKRLEIFVSGSSCHPILLFLLLCYQMKDRGADSPL